MVAGLHSGKRIARGGAGNQAFLWFILSAIGIVAGIGIFVTAGQSAALRKDFRRFSDHAMETAFHLHRMSMQIAELAAADLSAETDERRRAALATYRVTIAAQYANVGTGRFEYFADILGEDRPEVIADLRGRMDALNRSVPAQLARLREIDAPAAVAERGDAGSLRPLIADALRDAKRLNDGIRYAEALTFSMLRDALNRSGTISILTIFFFSLISVSSLVIMKMTGAAAKAREEALRSAKETAERLLEREREFLRNTSHELRTPVSGLLGMARLLAAEELPASAVPLSGNILAAAEDLSGLVAAILDSQAEFAPRQEDAAWTGLAAALGDAVARYRAAAQDKGLAFGFRDGTAGQEAYLSAAPVRAIVAAALSNAVKFTDAGSVALEAEAAGGKLVLRVRDTGIGMDARVLAAATERFFQAESSYTKRHRGLGLGLWTAKRLTESLGGELRVASESGVGTTVEAVLPVRLRPLAAAPAPGAPAPGDPAGRTPAPEGGPPTLAAPAGDSHGAEGGPPAIFVAEDDAINRMGLEQLLRRAGYAVLSACDGNAAMEVAENGDFQLAILDLSMPFHTGLEVLRRVRDREARSGNLRVPAFALTGHSTAEDRRSCMEAGFDDFITKPYNDSVLVSLIRKALAAGAP